MARVIFFKKPKKEEDATDEEPYSLTAYFAPPKNGKEDDFHINPSQAVNLPESSLELLRCTICCKFSCGKVHECQDRGHVICEDCYSLLDPSNGCDTHLGPWEKSVCDSPFRIEPPSKALGNLMSTLKFRCLYSTCKDLIGGDDWKTHLEMCPVLQEFVHCPDAVCKGAIIAKKKLISHCQEIHNVSLARLEENGCYYFVVDLCKLENGPAIVMTFQHEDRFIYLVAENDNDNYLRLVAFMVQWDAKWAARFNLLLTTRCSQSVEPYAHKITTTMRINPPHRDWDDVQHFARSSMLLYHVLDDLLFKNKQIPKDEKRYEFEVQVKDIKHIFNPPTEGSTWEPSSIEMEDEDVEATCQDKSDKQSKHGVKRQAEDQSANSTRNQRYNLVVDDLAQAGVDYGTDYPHFPNIRALQIFDDQFDV